MPDGASPPPLPPEVVPFWDHTRDEKFSPAAASVKVMMLNPIAVAAIPATAPEIRTRRREAGDIVLKRSGTERSRCRKPAERPSWSLRRSGSAPLSSSGSGGSGFGSAFGLLGTRTCCVERRPRTVLGRPEILVDARSS